VYAITDLHVHQAKPPQLVGLVRGRWSIESKPHWVRDVVYDEDRCQIRNGTGPQVMAALRNTAMSALRCLAGVTNIAAATRYHARDSNRPSTFSRSANDFAGTMRPAGRNIDFYLILIDFL
jgi:hypothetical protein